MSPTFKEEIKKELEEKSKSKKEFLSLSFSASIINIFHNIALYFTLTMKTNGILNKH